jgi:pheromone shutdown protein TraB
MNYKLVCGFGIVIGVVLLIIAIVEMVTLHKPHVGLIAWAVWFIFSSIMILVAGGSRDVQIQASDADLGQTIGFVMGHLGAGTILPIIGVGILAGVLTAIVGI